MNAASSSQKEPQVQQVVIYQAPRGAILTDVEGKEYIDFSGGIAVMNVGHSHPKVVAAIKDQAEKFTHTCFMVLPYGPAVQLAKKLCLAVPGDSPKSAMFVNSGAMAASGNRFLSIPRVGFYRPVGKPNASWPRLSI